jgi:transcriptional regulator with XRE-family HTH domain
MSIFNQNLIHLRESKGLTQEMMSYAITQIGIEPVKLKRYQAWEEGRAFPPEHILIAICDVLDYRDIYVMLTKRLNT